MADAKVPYWRLPAGWHTSDEGLRLGLLGRAVLFSFLDYCAEKLTDGVVTKAQMNYITCAAGTPEDAVDILVEQGVLVLRDGSYVMPDFGIKHRTRADVERLRAIRASAGRKGGRKRARNAVAAKDTSSKPQANSSSLSSDHWVDAGLGDGDPIGIIRPPADVHRHEAAV